MRLNYEKFKKYLGLVIIINLICLLVAIPSIAQAKIDNSPFHNKASVVLDGKVLFNVANFGGFTALERAEEINQALVDTIKYNDKITIDLVQIEDQITLQETNSEKHLLTVTQADVISAANPYNQALLWKNSIQKALNRGQKERTASYQSKALLISILVTLMAIAIHLAIHFLRSLSSRGIVTISRVC